MEPEAQSMRLAWRQSWRPVVFETVLPEGQSSEGHMFILCETRGRPVPLARVCLSAGRLGIHALRRPERPGYRVLRPNVVVGAAL